MQRGLIIKYAHCLGSRTLRSAPPSTSNLLKSLKSTTAIITFQSLLRPFSTSSSTPSSSDAELCIYLGYAALLFCGAAIYCSFPFLENAKHKKAQIFCYALLPEDSHNVSNWSGTHEVQTREVVKEAHEKKTLIRSVGSGLSPNGIVLSRVGVVNLALIDKILKVDKQKKTVRGQADIRVQLLVDGIKEHGPTLQNVACIGEQQIGGLAQVPIFHSQK